MPLFEPAAAQGLLPSAEPGGEFFRPIANLLLEHDLEAVAVIDERCRILAGNRSSERLSGWPRAQMVGRQFDEVFRVRDHAGEPLNHRFCPLPRLLDRAGNRCELQGVLKNREGEEVDVCLTVAARRDGNGSVYGVATLRDLTPLREVEDLRSTFVSVVSHELQTPISIIKGYASTLHRSDAAWDKQTLQRGLEVIEEEADRLSKLVKNLMYISRIEVGGLPMDTGPVQIAALVRRLVRKLEMRLSDRHSIRVSFPPDLPLVVADKEKIEEVVQNLIENAIKYSPDGGEILVEGWATGEEVVVAVTDEGVGIPLRERERIFDRFHRVDSGLARKTQGVGLGLFICRAIVHAHGGRIWVESAPGRGSRFVFSLPREVKAQLPMVSFAQTSLAPVSTRA
ncbi:MAG: PAS domain S-box protein [Chloroflexi bacterium]|nr:PAS domain S-box protein [Chloroflexota bacterium]